ncbi:hypothetical protein IB252_07790 [Pseudomonas sp. PDM10]|uniref:hypothetical protein n=1 Tax=Pseudomonas sp. PDM10 TaxID=2769269 RepID=UPI001785572B|nr:hypothetical protein [Pseudomonas sp. PDM10]MBD9599715.1 hypothetical protein [Pseudomonas sp. PDM10]
MLTTVLAIIFCFILWNVLKGVLRGTMSRSIQYAVSRGVPYDFAKGIMNHRGMVKESMSRLKMDNPELRAEDVYVQYGITIMYLFEISTQGERDV